MSFFTHCHLVLFASFCAYGFCKIVKRDADNVHTWVYTRISFKTCHTHTHAARERDTECCARHGHGAKCKTSAATTKKEGKKWLSSKFCQANQMSATDDDDHHAFVCVCVPFVDGNVTILGGPKRYQSVCYFALMSIASTNSFNPHKIEDENKQLATEKYMQYTHTHSHTRVSIFK